MSLAHALSPNARLAPLREDIAIFAGPAAVDGSPTWTLHDPVRNRFFRLGWPEFEILSRWETGDIATLLERLDDETPLAIEEDDIGALARFLQSFDLLRVTGPQATASLIAKAERQREHWARWLLHNYLFLRIPLLRPDRFLSATYPYMRWLYSRQFALAVAAVGLVGIYMIARQWDTFLHTFVDLLTLRGVVYFGVTLSVLKVVHELGHAYTAKRFGCRVPNMGIALLVLFPVLYTDVNESWKLTSRRQRLAIGVAGVAAELGCAAVAACAWGVLPDGPARSAAFLVATTTWISTVLINLSPFMRYDGYYVLSDWLETPNLHARAFALARWWLRETLFGFGDPVPEVFPPHRRNFLIVFAFVTWTYRFVLFLGIAVLVYHFAFKLIGIAMMAVEVGYFLLRPIMAEPLVWWRRRKELRWSGSTVWTAIATLSLVALLFVPWRSGLEVPALLKSRQHVDVFVPEFGVQIQSIAVRDGAEVMNDTPLISLVSPDLDYKLMQARLEMDVAERQMNSRGIDPTLLARSQVTEREYQAALAEYRALLAQKARLDVRSPISGRVVDVGDNLEPGEWLPAKSRLLSVVDAARAIAEGYIGESDLDRVAVGDKATFHAEADDRTDVALRVIEIARASTRVLREPYLASAVGGPIPAQADKTNGYVPEQTIYRLTLAPADGTLSAPEHVVRGHLIVDAAPISLARRLWLRILAIGIRESGA